MKIKAQVSMVLNLDKCLGCHTCSITCKNTWTNREGAEYMYFNNVETRPGVGYPRNWENQEKWKGGWTLDKSGNLALSTGSKGSRLMKLFYHPEQPEITDYFEPWTYDYETLIQLPPEQMGEVLRDLYSRGATIVSSEQGYGIYFRREDTLYFVEMMAENDRAAEVLLEAAREKEVIVEKAVITVGAAQNLFLGEGTRQEYGLIRFEGEPFDVSESYMRLMMD